MTPVDQLHLHSDEPDAEFGDCFRACVATLLDLPALEVPHFCRRPDPAVQWLKRTQDWLARRGLLYVEVNAVPWAYLQRPRRPLVIAGGKSPRGAFGHNVVGEISRDGFRLVHDPHPSRAGLVGEPEDYGIFMRLDELPNGSTT